MTPLYLWGLAPQHGIYPRTGIPGTVHARITGTIGRTAQCGLADWTIDDELREARRLFVELGATGSAERIADELR